MTGMRNESPNEFRFTDRTCSGRQRPTLNKSLLRDQKGTNASTGSYLLTDFNAANCLVHQQPTIINQKAINSAKKASRKVRHYLDWQDCLPLTLKY